MAETLESLLYDAIRELAYVQSVENCGSGLCASSAGKDIVECGIELLGVRDLAEETYGAARRAALEQKARA